MYQVENFNEKSFVLKLSIEKCRVLLERFKKISYENNEDYETICENVGFESFSYFCKMLKKYFDCSASKLRKGTAIMRKTL